MLTSDAPPAVVIVAYRADDHLAECIAALHDGSGPDAGARFDVVVVDNDAAAPTEQLCARLGVDYIGVPDNPGFATAVNVGLARRPGRDVLLLNPDARVTAAAVLALQRTLHAGGHAAVGPRLVDGEGRPQPADWPLPSPAQVWLDAFGLGHRARGPRFVTGAVLLLSATAIADLGGLDERYRLYAEEADWQRRARARGWTVAVVDEVIAVHAGSASSADPVVRERLFHASGRAYVRRWYGPVGAALMRSGTVVAAARRSLTARPAAGRPRVAPGGPAPADVPADVPTTRPAVVHVVRSDSFAGVERSVVDLAAAQHARGWRVTVVGGDAARVRAALPPGVATLPGTTTLQAWRSLRRAGKADVVHAHMTAAELAGALARRRLGARLVTTRHFAAPRGSSPAARVLAPLLARVIDDQLAISAFVAGALDEPSTVVPNGVVDAEGGTDRADTVVVLQRLEPEKRTDVALRAWAASALPGAGWRLVVHGRGGQDAALRALAAELGCADSVEFAGFTDDVPAALARAGIVLATAPGEPFGLTVAEAMATATPVVAADGGAHREVLGPDGCYFAPDDPAAAAAALDGLGALSPEERADLGAALQRRQRTLFGLDRQVDTLLERYRPAAPRVALLSLEPWDDVWRRNQHFAARVVGTGAASSLVFVEPPAGGLALRARRRRPVPGVEVVTPPLVVPRRAGGHRVLGHWLRHALAGADVVWVNDPVAGATVVRDGRPAVYDVTDDWRSLDQPAADRARIVAAEDALARTADTVVCSAALAERWTQRYGIVPPVISNGVDLAALRAARPVELTGPAPHLVYVGTAHPNRVDVALLLRLVDEGPGTLHLVGPDGLAADDVARLRAGGAQLHGPVPQHRVPSWLAAADVLVCPHRVDDFTRSLDAIKSYEYLATTAPVVATPSSGFQAVTAGGLTVVAAEGFVAAVAAAAGTGPFVRPDPPDWDERAARFGAALRAAVARRRG